MDTKTTDKDTPGSRQGDHGLGTPRSRMDGARVLSDQEIEETQRLEQEESRQQSDTEPQQFATVKPNTTTTEPPEPATGDHRSETHPSPRDAAAVLSVQEIERTPRLVDEESRQSSDTEPRQLAKVDAETTTTDSPELRQGDHGLGTPRSRMDGARVLSEQEIEEARRVEDEALRRQFEKELQQPAAFALPSGIRRALTWSGLALAAVLGLFVVSQFTAAVTSIATLPVPFDWIVGLLAVLFAGILSWMILRLAVALFRLQRSPSVNLRAIQALQERRHMQALVAEHAEQAIHELRNYLENYQLNDEARRRLKGLGLTDGEWDDLVFARRSLLANDESMPADAWLSAFRSQFQSVLDGAAERRVRHYAKHVGLGTALAPLAVLDNAVVLYACVALIKDLTFLYGLRPALGQTATILARSIIQTYLGGLSQQGAAAVSDNLQSTLQSEMSGFLASTLSVVATKVTEGAVNGVLLWRLGRRAITFLQPVQPAD